VGISKLLRSDHAALPRNVHYLFEPTGIVPRSMPNGGVLFRPIPCDVKSGKLILAPMFSLVGGSENHPPLLLTIIERTGMNIHDFMHDVVCAGFAKSWVQMSMRNGLILEAHGQNLLLALSADFEPLGQFYYRDFQDLMVDWDFRRMMGNASPTTMPNAWSWHETYDSGYFCSNLLSKQFEISIKHYMKFVIEEMELVLRHWHENGIGQTPRFEIDEFTAIFSHQIMKAVHEVSGVCAGAEYNIYRSLARFSRFLLNVRMELIRQKSSLSEV
jgi:hypothetical protein